MAISELDLKRRTGALPPSTEATTALSEVDVLRFDQKLGAMGSSLPQLVRNAVDGMASEVTDELPHTTEGYIIVNPDQIQVIITKAALAGGAAVEAEVGESLALARELEEAFLET